MKDSRIGTYGASALVMALLGKYLLLIESTQLITALLIAYPLSRALSGSLLFSMRYVADADTSKSKPLANHQSRTDLCILLLSALPFFALLPPTQALLLAAFLLVLRQLAIRYLQRQIGGYTGDTLGAVQQVAELGIYAVLLIFL